MNTLSYMFKLKVRGIRQEAHEKIPLTSIYQLSAEQAQGLSEYEYDNMLVSEWVSLTQDTQNDILNTAYNTWCSDLLSGSFAVIEN